mgnify:FL=1
MISLKEYIESQNNLHDKLFCQNRLNELATYFGESIEDIPKDIQESYINHTFELNFYLYETLKSHDVDSLMNHIEKEYKDNIYEICTINRSNKHGLVGVKFNNKQLYYVNSSKFLDICTFFNYVKTDTWNGYIILEPEYPDKCNNETMKLFKNKFIHVTTKKNYEKIKVTGLRMRGHDGKDGYRKYSSRIQLKGKESKESILKFAREFKQTRKESDDENHLDWENTVVLLVDLYTVNFDIWRDHMYDKEDHCYFVKNNIPDKYIKKLYEV